MSALHADYRLQDHYTLHADNILNHHYVLHAHYRFINHYTLHVDYILKHHYILHAHYNSIEKFIKLKLRTFEMLCTLLHSCILFISNQANSYTKIFNINNQTSLAKAKQKKLFKRYFCCYCYLYKLCIL